MRKPCSTEVRKIELNENNRYQVALSYASEQRDYVEEVARFLAEWGIGVFYDEFEAERLWGMDLSEELQRVFEKRSDVVVMFVSGAYVQKPWPELERRSVLRRMGLGLHDCVLPVRFDDAPIPGLPTTVRCESAVERTPAEIAGMIAKRLGVQSFELKASKIPPPRAHSSLGETVFNYANHDGRYVIGSGQWEFETMWTKASDNEIHVYNDPASINGVAIAVNCGSISEVRNARNLNYTSRCRTAKLGDVVVLRNANGFYAAVQVLSIKDDSRGDDVDELCIRYAIQRNGSDDFSEVLD